MFMGPLDKSKPWNTKGLQGSYRFLQKVWKLCIESRSKINNEKPLKETLRLLHHTIKKVTEDLEELSFNTAVSQMMIFVNHALTLESLNEEVLKNFLIILNPFAPHISEEIYEILEYNVSGAITDQSWPKIEDDYLKNSEMNIAIQFNGKTRGVISIPSELNKDEILNKIKKDQKFGKYFEGSDIKKEIYVPNRIVNFVVIKN
tara:strand:+ start:1 stop:609 length:609 start_codon:yes stop_codon:yes gene_type:complete